MAAALHIALVAKQGTSGVVSEFDVEVGLERARQHLEDDGAG